MEIATFWLLVACNVVSVAKENVCVVIFTASSDEWCLKYMVLVHQVNEIRDPSIQYLTKAKKIIHYWDLGPLPFGNIPSYWPWVLKVRSAFSSSTNMHMKVDTDYKGTQLSTKQLTPEQKWKLHMLQVQWKTFELDFTKMVIHFLRE